MLRRETIIALRARHTAFRIAINILYPPQSAPPPPMPDTPPPDPFAGAWWVGLDPDVVEDIRQRSEAAERRRGRRVALAAALFAAACLGILIYALVADTEDVPVSPPPPPARPILPATE